MKKVNPKIVESLLSNTGFKELPLSVGRVGRTTENIKAATEMYKRHNNLTKTNGIK